MAAADTSKDLSLSLSGVDASADRAKERAEARGDEIAVTFALPDGSSVTGSFGQGQEIGALKLWLVEEACFSPTGLVIKFGGTPLIDMFSLADIEGIKGEAEATVEVEGTLDETRKTSRAADAEAAAALDEATADDA